MLIAYLALHRARAAIPGYVEFKIAVICLYQQRIDKMYSKDTS